MILVRTGKKCMFWSTYFKLSLKVFTPGRNILLIMIHKMVCTCMYSVHTSTYFFYWFGTAFLSFLQDTNRHILRTSEYILCRSCIFCGPAGHCWFACKRILHWNTHSTKAHYIRFINCCLAGPLPVPASVLHHDWAVGTCAALLGDAAAAGQLCTTLRRQILRWWSVAC